MVVDAIKEIGAQSVAGIRNHEHAAGAVVGVAVAALAQLDEGLVVARKLGQAYPLQGKGAAGIVQHAVKRCVFAIVAFDVVIFLSPTELHIVKNAGGNDQFLFLDSGKFTPGDTPVAALFLQRNDTRLPPKFRLGQLIVNLTVAFKTNHHALETSVVW